VPTDIIGLQNITPDDEILRLENTLRDSIEPRIPGISKKPVPLQNSDVAIIIRVPRSWNQPHVVRYQKHWRFYSRNSAGKYPLDVSEVRSAFALSETIAERIRLFRTERLGKIIASETPSQITGTAKTVIHIIPIGAFGTTEKFDLSILGRYSENIPTNFFSGANNRHNFDGLLTYTQANNNYDGRYLQIFHNGILEGVEASHLSRERIIRHIPFERELLRSLPQLFSIQKQLGVEPPLFIMLSLMGVKDYSLSSSYNFLDDYINLIDRNELIIPDIKCDDFDSDSAVILRPAFDAIWNAAGFPRCLNYNENDEWTGRYS